MVGPNPFLSHRLLAALFASVLLFTATAAVHAADGKLPQAVDIDRYAGTWHEIARLPHFFQRKCARDVTANYSRNGEFIRVINRCVQANGKAMQVEGRARVVDAPTNRKLKVGFFSLFGWWPFEGDYWILAIDPEYRWVIVGHPEREYGWILARTPVIDAATRRQLDGLLTSFGYDPKTFVTTPP